MMTHARRIAIKKWRMAKKDAGIETEHRDGNNFSCGFVAGWREGRRELHEKKKEK